MDAGIIAALITAIVSVSVSGITWFSTRRKNSAEAYDKLSATVERQDGRMEQLRIEIDELRARIATMEDEGSIMRGRIVTLEGEVSTLTKYLKRVIAQLKAAGGTPDLPPEVIERLFKGTEG